MEISIWYKKVVLPFRVCSNIYSNHMHRINKTNRIIKIRFLYKSYFLYILLIIACNLKSNIIPFTDIKKLIMYGYLITDAYLFTLQNILFFLNSLLFLTVQVDIQTVKKVFELK